jgi:hypothetical protein
MQEAFRCRKLSDVGSFQMALPGSALLDWDVAASQPGSSALITVRLESESVTRRQGVCEVLTVDAGFRVIPELWYRYAEMGQQVRCSHEACRKMGGEAVIRDPALEAPTAGTVDDKVSTRHYAALLPDTRHDSQQGKGGR